MQHWKCDIARWFYRSFGAIGVLSKYPGATLRSPLANLYPRLQRLKTIDKALAPTAQQMVARGKCEETSTTPWLTCDNHAALEVRHSEMVLSLLWSYRGVVKIPRGYAALAPG